MSETSLKEDRLLQDMPATAPASAYIRFRLWLRTTRQGIGAIGTISAIVLVLLVLVAVFAGFIAPYAYDDIDVLARLEAPSSAHWFGTDNLGRDLFSRVIYGTQGILTTAVSAALLGVILGACIGMVSGYIGGWFDDIVMRMVDAFLTIPAILFALLLLVTMGSSRWSVILGIGIVYTPVVARVVRSAVLAIKGREFVSAARLRGEKMGYILFQEILPNILGPIVVEASVRISYAVLLTASFGFLGLGVQEPQPDWGLMVSRGREYMQIAPWMVLIPVAAISILVISISLFADALQGYIVAPDLAEEGSEA